MNLVKLPQAVLGHILTFLSVTEHLTTLQRLSKYMGRLAREPSTFPPLFSTNMTTSRLRMVQMVPWDKIPFTSFHLSEPFHQKVFLHIPKHKLHALYIYNVNVTMPVHKFAKAIQACHQLKTVWFAGHMPEHVMALMENLPPHLTDLRLSHTGLRNKHVAAWPSQLPLQLKTLELTYEPITTRAIPALMARIQPHPTLEDISLTCYNINHQGFQTLVTQLPHTLKAFKFASYDAEDEPAMSHVWNSQTLLPSMLKQWPQNNKYPHLETFDVQNVAWSWDTSALRHIVTNIPSLKKLMSTNDSFDNLVEDLNDRSIRTEHNVGALALEELCWTGERVAVDPFDLLKWCPKIRQQIQRLSFPDWKVHAVLAHLRGLVLPNVTHLTVNQMPSKAERKQLEQHMPHLTSIN